ncbi:hypothetical protein GGP99_001920 [Salinibacter ruber]|uniref:Transposase IS4-like domain-containing protein n=1 Tax=Salinibacter ruber TaxID=146919 RepID=A0AAW5P7U9_9BACT|nr:hypothetical protein [Salinibacter ruber]
MPRTRPPYPQKFRENNVDTIGLLLGVLVHPANEHDSQMALFLLQRSLGRVSRPKKIFADSGYKGFLGGLVWRCFHWLLRIVRGEEKSTGFEPLPKR